MNGARSLRRKRGLARIGHPGRQIQQRLLFIAEMGRHHQLSRLAQAKPLSQVGKTALHGQRRGGENHAGVLLEEQVRKQLGNIDRGGLQVGIAHPLTHGRSAAAFDPEDGIHAFRFHQKAQVLADVSDPLLQAQRLFHPAQPLQFPFHPVQRVGHRQVEIAVLLQKLLALLKGHAAFSLKTARPR